MEDNLIILAPSALHLPLYQAIYARRGSCLNITVLTLESYIAQKLSRPKTTTAHILYQYKEALADLDKDNTFYASRADYDFLKDCHNFMLTRKLFDLKTLPAQDKREQDLSDIVKRLDPISLWVEEARDLIFEDACQVRLLEVESTLVQQYFTRRLLEQGAQKLSGKRHAQEYYWSAANPRKEMEACADAIVFNELDASDTMIALADDKERYVLAQALESRSIPYTFAQEAESSSVIGKFKAAFSYVMNPTQEQLITLLRTLYGPASHDICRWLELFGAQSVSLAEKPWEENSLISAEDYQALQALEAQCASWTPLLDSIRAWSWQSFDAIESVIQKTIPEPLPLDLQSAQGVRDGYETIRPYLHEAKDLQLFVRSLDTMHPSGAMKELKGVFIGRRDQISSLFANTFYIGADAAHYPGSVRVGGVFGEEYLAKTDFPSLETRMKDQLAQLQSVLMEPENLWLLTPQSSADGKAVEESHDLTTWLARLPVFKNPSESSTDPKPVFKLGSTQSANLFGKDGTVTTRIQTLQKFEDCPLRSLLQYGLNLRSPMRAREYLKVGAQILPMMMKKGVQVFRKPFYQLSLEEIRQLVDLDFAFAREVFPQDVPWIDQLAAQTALEIQTAFSRLEPVCTQMHLNVAQGNYELNLSEHADGLNVDIQGPLAQNSFSSASFNLYPDAPEGFEVDMMQPEATLSLSLQPKPVDSKAYTLSYGTKSKPAQAVPVDLQTAREDSTLSFLSKAMAGQDLKSSADGLSAALSKKVRTYEQREEKLLSQARDYAKAMKDNEFQPVHAKSACAHCPYRAICRNAAIEKGE